MLCANYINYIKKFLSPYIEVCLFRRIYICALSLPPSLPPPSPSLPPPSPSLFPLSLFLSPVHAYTQVCEHNRKSHIDEYFLLASVMKKNPKKTVLLNYRTEYW